MSAIQRLRAASDLLAAPFRRGTPRTVPAAVLPGSELIHLGGGEAIPCPGIESLPLSPAALAQGLGMPSLAMPASKVHVLRDVTVLPGSGVVRDGQGRIVVESLTGAPLTRTMVGRAHRSGHPPPPLHLDGPVALYRSPLRGELHTLLDHLPRAALLAQPAVQHLGRITLLHDGPLDPFEELLLPRLVGNRVDLLEVDPAREVHAERVLVPSSVGRPGAGAIPSWYRRWIDRTATSLHDPSSPLPRRFFVHGAPGDPVVRDRHRLDGVLARHQVEVLDLSTLRAEEQVRAFRNAELVLGLPGDGLARAVFCRSAEVVELVPGTQVPAHTYYLCASKGLPYDYVPNCGAARGERRPHQVDIDADAVDRALSRLALTPRPG